MSLVGNKAPHFTMPSTKNFDTLEEPVSLDDYKGKWLVLFFYPADFTFVCPTEVTAFGKHTEDFASLNAEVVGVSTDGVYCHQAWCEFAIGKQPFPLASDCTLETSKSYGVLLEDEGIAQRGLFIIDPEGVVRYEVIHDIDSGRNVTEVVRVLTAVQTGQKTAAGWAPGDPTLVVEKAA